MLILIVTDFELERVSTLASYNDTHFALALRDMEELADNFKEMRIIKDAHYPKEIADTFFNETEMSIHCKADCGDNVKWEILKV